MAIEEDYKTMRAPAILVISACSIATLCLVLFIIDQLGLDIALSKWLMFLFLIVACVMAGATTKTMSAHDWFASRKQSKPFYSGMAIAAAILSSIMITMLTGQFYQSGFEAFITALAVMASVIVMGTFIAPYMKNSGAYTPADFVGARSQSTSMRVLLVLTTVLVSGFLLVAQLLALVLIGAFGFQISPVAVLGLTLGALVIMLVLGGLRSLTVGRAIMFAVIMVGLFLPMVWLSQISTSNPIPQTAFGYGALQSITQLADEMARHNVNSPATTQLFSADTSFLLVPANWLIFLCIAGGTAALPHILHLSVSEKGTYSARQSTNYALFYLVIFLSLIPAIAVFLHWEVIGSVSGLKIGEVGDEISWLFMDSPIPVDEQIRVCGKVILDIGDIVSACGGNANQLFDPADIELSPILIVLKGAEIAGLSNFLSVLLAGGLMAAALSTLDGLIFSIAACLSHDIYFVSVRPKSPALTRIFWARLLLVATAIAFGWIAWQIINAGTDDLPEMAITLTILSLSLSFAVLFPQMILSIWWSRLSKWGAIAGCIAGLLVYFAMTLHILFGRTMSLATIDDLLQLILVNTSQFHFMKAGLAGFVASVAVAIGVSLVRKVSKEELSRLERLRHPSDKPLVMYDMV